MLRTFSEPSRRTFLLRIVTPIFLTAMVLSIAASTLLLWATYEVDRASDQRQRSLVVLVLSQLRAGIAHDQEGVAVWDDALTAAMNGDTEWIDVNLGRWMQTYFGHDGAYVLDPRNNPIYAFPKVEARSPHFQQLMARTMPLAAKLRERLRGGDTTGLSDRVLTLGVADFVVVSGRPAVVSVKPIVSDTGDIPQAPGNEFLHVAVRYLDDSFITELKQDYLLDNLRFSWLDNASATEISSPLTSSRGETIGYFVWQPYRPGTTLLSRVAPVMVVVFLVAMTMMALLVSALRRRSLKLIESEATVRHLAHHDQLTDLPNRGLFNDRLDGALKSLAQSGETIAVLYLDLDRFKEVNDTFGHPSGDALLRDFAHRIREIVGERDTIARIGGDEFTILLRAVHSRAKVEAVCRRIVEAARHPYPIAGTQVFVGVSIGVAMAPQDGVERVELTRRADVALYHCKRAGRSDFAIYVPEMDASSNARRDLERDLRTALDADGQILVHYQPLYSTAVGRITGVEALVRWRHPERGWVPPDTFVPLAEETGLIGRLGAKVLREACETAAGWPVESLAVNVSAIELRNPNYAMQVTNVLLATGFNPRRLELEVTESALAERESGRDRNIAALRELGVRFALDDFGTGFSSLGRLHELEVDRIKIDRSFVQGFGTANGDEAIVQAIVDLARATGLKTTAEGVETASQSDYLRHIGCDDLQGFLLSRPLPRQEVEALLRAQPDEPRVAATRSAHS
ncbi:MAG: EAL domain-containing protein [Rhizobiaceae bacterium]|nr:EAL domain-containing protein [Rhizobiaceae bacterium]